MKTTEYTTGIETKESITPEVRRPSKGEQCMYYRKRNCTAGFKCTYLKDGICGL